MAESNLQWEPDETAWFAQFMSKTIDRLRSWNVLALARAMVEWRRIVTTEKKKRAQMSERNDVLTILRDSVAGQRSTQEREKLRKFIASEVSCIPSKDLSFSEMDCLCNEVTWFPCEGRSIVFLQGDFGNCYYVIASGAVSLYLESSKDKEMVIGREIGKLRGQPLPPNFDTDQLGKCIITLNKGAGFGEFAILSTTQKLRSASAVACTEDALLLILQSDTYNTCLRKFHYRQRTLSTATKLLQELPLFSFASYSTVSQIAYAMKNVTFSGHTNVVQAGQPIRFIYLVFSGRVKVYPPTDSSVDKRLPQLSISVLGRGQLIGDTEARKRMSNFQYSYRADSSGCELFEIPISVYMERARSSVEESSYVKFVDEIAEERESENSYRLLRVGNAIRQMLHPTGINYTAPVVLTLAGCDYEYFLLGPQLHERKAEMLSLLPCIVQSPTFSSRSSVARGDSTTVSSSTQSVKLSMTGGPGPLSPSPPSKVRSTATFQRTVHTQTSS